MSETMATAISFLGLALIVLIPYLWWIRRKEYRSKSRREEAKVLGLDKAIAQHPLINQSSCIGCASCVLACPEHALGMIEGVAELVQPAKCVGHGICAEACPVSAIRIVLDPTKSTAEIPILDETYQSNIPNIYLVGELGGMALIRNAIFQGKTVVDHIHEKLKVEPRLSTDLRDLVIVGAGPSGLSAALRAKEHGLDFVVLEKENSPGGAILSYPRQKLVMTVPVEIPVYGWLRKRELSKEDLLNLWTDIIRQTALNVDCSEKLENVVQQDGHLAVTTASGRTIHTRHVSLALGRRGTPRKLGIPGEDSAKVAYQLIEAVKYAQKKILVVGAGDSAIEAALGLANQKGTTVTLANRGDDFPGAKPKNRDRIKDAASQGRLTVLYASKTREIFSDAVEIETPDGLKRIDNDYVFAFIGGEMPTPFLKKIGIEFMAKERSIAA